MHKGLIRCFGLEMNESMIVCVLQCIRYFGLEMNESNNCLCEKLCSGLCCHALLYVYGRVFTLLLKYAYLEYEGVKCNLSCTYKT